MKNRIYIATLMIFACATSNAQKMSPSTMLMMNDFAESKSKGMGTTTVSAFVTIKNQDVLDEIRKAGATVNCVLSDSLITATIPMSAIDAIAKLDDVVSVSVGTGVHMLMDEARKQTGVDDCQVMTTDHDSFTGKGVVVGVVDNGFEFTHVDFKNADLSDTRIKRVWDQNTNGKAPEKYGYGAEYTSMKDIKWHPYDMLTTYHGTHVTGIATGSDKTVPYYGVAPDADIVLVSYKDSNADIVNGIKYIFDYADSVGKPAVVNISLGSHIGPHDGTFDTDLSFAGMTGPGHIIVGACGNEGDTKLHVSKTLKADDSILKTMLTNEKSEDGQSFSNYIDIWGGEDAKLSVKAVVVNTFNGNIVEESEEVSTDGAKVVKWRPSDNKKVSASIYLARQVNPTNHRTNIIMSSSATAMTQPYTIGIVVTGDEGQTVNMWNATQNAFKSFNKTGWTDGDTESTVGELGGVSPDVISVGSFNSKNKFVPLGMEDTGDYLYLDEKTIGKLYGHSSFSSHGPTADGRIKPDVSAPGCLVISAASRYASVEKDAIVAQNGSDIYAYNVGTSMASPFVTGTVALWLQANPSLTPAQIRKIISHTASADQYVGSDTTLPNNIWGYGKIDALAGLKEVLHTTGIKDVEQTYNLFKVMTDRSKHTATFYLGDKNNVAKVDVYNVLGQKVESKTISSDGETIDFSNLAGGVYLFKIEQGNVVKTVKAFI